jgi:uncharacterized membrane protein YphA (DoxX/SURF4 family)
MPAIDLEQPISAIRVAARSIATDPAVFLLALLAMCAPYLQGAVRKVMDFNGAVDEVRKIGLSPPAPFALATILTEFGGSALILSGYLRWMGALWLAIFTFAATLLARRFWARTMPDRASVENTVFEHIGLIGGLLVVAWCDLARG